MSATGELPLAVSGDRRREPRTDVAVGCQAVTDFDFVLLGESIVNLSTTGLLLKAEGVPAEVGELVILSFQPPGSAVWIDVEARVARLINGTEPGAPGFGLELVEELPPFERGLLEAALERSTRARERAARRRVRAPRARSGPRGNGARRQTVVEVGEVKTRPIAVPETGLARRIFIVG